MNSEQPVLFLGEHMSQEAIGPDVHKRFLKKGRWVHFIPFLIADYWVFLKGAVLGYSRRDRFDLLVASVAAPGMERESAEHRRKQANHLMSAYEGESQRFDDLWFKAAFESPVDLPALVLDKDARNRELRLGNALNQFNDSVLTGIGFGATYPDETVTLWRTTLEGEVGRSIDFTRLSDDQVSALREMGPSVPFETMKALPLEEMEKGVLEDYAEYVAGYKPDLIDPLDLRPYLQRTSV